MRGSSVKFTPGRIHEEESFLGLFACPLQVSLESAQRHPREVSPRLMGRTVVGPFFSLDVPRGVYIIPTVS